MEILTSIGAIIITIGSLVLALMGMIFIISLMGRATNTTFITRGGNKIHPFQTRKEVSEEIEKDKNVKAYLNDLTYKREIQREFMNNLIFRSISSELSDAKSINSTVEKVSLRIINVASNSFQNSFSIITETSVYNESGLWSFDISFAEKQLEKLGFYEVEKETYRAIDMLNSLVSLPPKIKLELLVTLNFRNE
jgi:hypothetical protein